MIRKCNYFFNHLAIKIQRITAINLSLHGNTFITKENDIVAKYISNELLKK